MSNAEECIVCGTDIPEGRQVCLQCESRDLVDELKVRCYAKAKRLGGLKPFILLEDLEQIIKEVLQK